jgi:hypothetical protein
MQQPTFLIYGLFSDAVSSDHIALNGRFIYEWWIGKDWFIA